MSSVRKVQAPAAAAVDFSASVKTSKGPNGSTNVAIDMKVALDRADPNQLRTNIGSTGPVTFALSRFDKKEPYGLVMLATSGRLGISRGTGHSSVDDKYGTIIDAGPETIKVFSDSNETKLLATLNITVSNMPKPVDNSPKPVPAPQPYRAAYEQYFSEGRFDFSPGYAKGKLEKMTQAAVSQFPAIKKALGILKRGGGSELEIFFEKQSQSYAIARYTEGESDHDVLIWDKTGKRIGTYQVDDAGDKWFYLPVKK